MKIAFHEIIGAELTRRIIDDSWFPDSELERAGPVEARIRIRRRSDDQIEITGSLTASINAACNRCCQSVPIDLSGNFDYDCVVGKEASHTGNDTECREEDYNRLYLDEPVIDLGEIFREQLYLALPASVLCRRACKGLCHNCGADLNNAECGCDPSNPSSPFAVLGQLKGT